MTEFDHRFITDRIETRGIKCNTEEIISDVDSSYQLLLNLNYNQPQIVHSQFHFFIDFVFFQILGSFIKIKKEKSASYKRLVKISNEAKDINTLLWFLCFRQLEPDMLDRIMNQTDYDFFWYPYAFWLEQLISKAADSDEEKLIPMFLKNRLSTIREIHNKEWLTIEEVSTYTNIAVGTIYNYVSKGKIPHNKVGGLKFNRKEIDRWLEAHRFNPDEIEKQMREEGLI